MSNQQRRGKSVSERIADLMDRAVDALNALTRPTPAPVPVPVRVNNRNIRQMPR